MYGYIYLTTNLVNSKKYIGKDKWDFRSKSYLGSGKLLEKAIEKYGRCNFKKEILCECKTKEELNQKEIEYISKFGAVDSSDFYNIAPGGEGGLDFSEESRKKLSKYRKGQKHSVKTKRKISVALSGKNHPLWGKHHSEETKIKMSLAKIGRKFTEEHKKKISDANKGKNNYLFGKHLSEETKKKLSLANLGKPGPNLGKRFSQEYRKNMANAAKRRWAREREGNR